MVRKPKQTTPNKDELQTESTDISSKKEPSTVIRRSGRLRNISPPSQNNEIQPFVEINLIEDDDVAYEMNADEDPLPSENSLEEKIDCILRAVDELKSKASRMYPEDDVPTTDCNYKSLYFDTQKKIEVLTKENYELSKKAEVAHEKLEAYNKASHVWSEVLGQVKDVFMNSKLPNAIRKAKNLPTLPKAVNLSSPSKRVAEPHGANETQSDAKQKKKAKLNKAN